MSTSLTAQSLRRFAASASCALLALSLMATPAHATDLVVSAAASLTNAFKDLGAAFEQQNPGVKVINNFGASDILMQQIVRGAPADVFASADQTAMDKAIAEKAVQASTRKNFAANQIVLIVPGDSTLPLASLKDLTQPAVKKVALGNPASVPFGRYTKTALESAGLWDAILAKGVMAQNRRHAGQGQGRDPHSIRYACHLSDRGDGKHCAGSTGCKISRLRAIGGRPGGAGALRLPQTLITLLRCGLINSHSLTRFLNYGCSLDSVAALAQGRGLGNGA